MKPVWSRAEKTATVAAEYLRSCRERGLADRTIEKYRYSLELLAQLCPKLPRKARDLSPVVTQPQHGEASRRKLRVILNGFFRWYGRRRRWPNPVKELEPMPKRKKLPRVFTRLEMEQVNAVFTSQRDRALLWLVMDTGLRVGEVAALTWPDVGPDYLMVRDGKTGDRVVPVSPEVKRLLLGLGDGCHIWTGRKGPLTRSGVRQVYCRLFRRAGLTGAKLGPHTLRHTFGTTYMANGGNVFSLQSILGHTSISTTQVYVNLAQAQVKADHARHSPARALGLEQEESG